MRISGSDIHLLSVFECVARSKGLTAAQAELGLSQPTISNHITALEERLGVTLCQRGRRGFLLTDKGQAVYDLSKALLETLEDKSDKLSALKGGLTGRLLIAVVDCLATDENLRLPQAISEMSRKAPDVQYSIVVKQPQEVLNGLSDGLYHVGIGSFDNKINGLTYEDIYEEKHSLYCGSTHILLSRDLSDLTIDDLRKYPWAHRGYWNRQRLRQVRKNELDSVVNDIEAQIFLLLSNQYLGLLPEHAADRFVSDNRLVKLPVGVADYSCQMQLVSRSGKQPNMVELFKSLLKGTLRGP